MIFSSETGSSLATFVAGGVLVGAGDFGAGFTAATAGALGFSTCITGAFGTVVLGVCCRLGWLGLKAGSTGLAGWDCTGLGMAGAAVGAGFGLPGAVGLAGASECVAASSASARLANPPTGVAGAAGFGTVDVAGFGGCGSAGLLGTRGRLATGDAGTGGLSVAAGGKLDLASEGAGLMVVIGGVGCLGERFLAITGWRLGFTFLPALN